MKYLLTFLMILNVAYSMEIVGHRGASLVAPENSLSAIQKALEYGVDGTEFDVYLTLDKKVVISHDPTLKRLARYDAKKSQISRQEFDKIVSTSVTKLTYDQIKSVDVGSSFSAKFKGESSPLLSDVLEILPKDKKYLVEIKDSNPEIAKYLKELIEEYGMSERQIEFISFDKKQVNRMKKELPTFRAILLLGCDSLNVLPQTAKDSFDGYDVEICPLVTKKYVQTILNSQKLIYVWNNKARGTDREAIASLMSNYGVDLFTSNLPLDVVNWRHLNK